MSIYAVMGCIVLGFFVMYGINVSIIKVLK